MNYQEKLNQHYCSICNLYLPLSDKSSHLNSDNHKQRLKEQHVWCEDCDKNISDKARHFQSEIHIQNRQQNNFNLDTGDNLHTGGALRTRGASHTLRTQFSNIVENNYE